MNCTDLRQQITEPAQRGIEAQATAHVDRSLRLACRTIELVEAFGGCSEWFLDEDVITGGERSADIRDVAACRRRDDGGGRASRSTFGERAHRGRFEIGTRYADRQRERSAADA